MLIFQKSKYTFAQKEVMKKYVIGVLILTGLLAALSYYFDKTKQLRKQIEIADSNIANYNELLSSSREKNTALQLTVDQVKTSKDSIIQELEKTRKKLKIKSKNVQSMQQVNSSFSRTDTICIKDTIFKEPKLAIDTFIGDKWYHADVKLAYPSTIIFTPIFVSKKNIIVYTKKETVNPPKKLWILRLFQKKHTILKVDVVEQNPYVKDSNSRYVKIIK